MTNSTNVYVTKLFIRLTELCAHVKVYVYGHTLTGQA